ncbi:MAG: cytochrome P450 [Gammaproteobacteria bacterium]
MSAVPNDGPGVPVPPHVAPDRVVDFDFIADSRYRADVHDGILGLMREAPGIFWTPRNGGHWVVARHREMTDVSRDTEVFSSRRMGLPPMQDEPVQIPINLDPPEHTKYRAVLNAAFAPRVIDALEADVRALAGRLIDAVADRGGCDFVTAVAEPLPVSIFMQMMGIPLDRLADFRLWVREILGQEGLDRRTHGKDCVMSESARLLDERRRQPRADLLSRLLATRVDGRELAQEELLGFCLLLVIGGLDTVMNGMSFGVRHLALDQAAQARLRAEPARVREAVEELLRRYTFTAPARIVTRDAEYGGVRFRAGDRVLLLLAAADLDSQAFPQADRFDLDRANKTHMAFNVGPHRCVGSHLARLELRVLYEEWLRRIPTFRLDAAHPPRYHAGHVIGIDSLPLAWQA